ncbi:MAG: hypothetical protein H0S85_12675 [Desulfovibrionaceae bacterium]|nr:hypothetical protein [Desulfovibrionaceae bacterium]
MEVSWYLRFGRRDVVEALVKESSLDQLEHMLYVETDWRMSTGPADDAGGGLLARFTRK